MKTLLTLLALAGIMLIATTDLDARGRGKGRCGDQNTMRGGQGACAAMLSDAPLEDLSEYETSILLTMREEEKLARDVYLALGERYDLRVFTNIPRAEDRHMARVADLLERYGLEDPVGDLPTGEFESDEFQKLHDDLVAQGSESLVQALTVGATIEDLDIKDLNEALERVDNEDIIMVFENLNRGSRNHMRAFVGGLERQGATYTAQYISQEELEAILESDHERGGNGRGQGRRGKGQGTEGRGRNRDW